MREFGRFIYFVVFHSPYIAALISSSFMTFKGCIHPQNLSSYLQFNLKSLIDYFGFVYQRALLNSFDTWLDQIDFDTDLIHSFP